MSAEDHTPKTPTPNTLIDRERIRGASRIIPEGTDAKNVTAEQIAQVAADLESFRRAYKITRKHIAKAAGYSEGVISEFISGKYAGTGAQVAIDVEGWLVEEEHRRSRASTTQFVWTNVAMTIKATASYCLDFRKIGMVYGPDASGIGKTIALRAIQQELGPRRCTLATIDECCANPTGLTRKICASMAIDDSGSNRNRFDRLVKHLTERSHLLIIDQVHNLRWAKQDKPLYYLTDLFDATGAAQLWCGTADMVSYLERQQSKSADPSLAQICSRVFPRVDLMEGVRADGSGGSNGEPLVTALQVREMFGKNRLKLTDAAIRFLARICNQPESGSVRLCVQIVEYATMLADMRNLKSIDAPLLQEAMGRGLSLVRSSLLLGKMDIEPARAAKAG